MLGVHALGIFFVLLQLVGDLGWRGSFFLIIVFLGDGVGCPFWSSTRICYADREVRRSFV